MIGIAPLIGRKKILVLIVLASLSYALLTGFQIPILRAFIMVGLSSLVQIIGREGEGLWVLAIAGGLMLIMDPSWLLSISFQLSFLATFGVLGLAPLIVKKLSWLPEVIRQDVGVSLSAQALIWPIIAYNFHQVGLPGLLANLLVLWTVPLVMLRGCIMLGVSVISFRVCQTSVHCPGLLLTYFTDAVMFCNQLPFSSLQVNDSSILLWTGYYLILLGGYLRLRPDDR